MKRVGIWNWNAAISFAAILVLESVVAEQCSQNSSTHAMLCVSNHTINLASNSTNLCGQINQVGECLGNVTGITGCLTSLPMISDYQARIHTCQNIRQLNGWVGFLNQSNDTTFQAMSNCVGNLIHAVITNKTNINAGCIENFVNLWNQRDSLDKTAACQQFPNLLIGCLQVPVQTVCGQQAAGLVQKIATVHGASDIIMSVCQNSWPDGHHSANGTSQMKTITLQATHAMVQATNSTSHGTNSTLHATNATLHATNATLHASNATLHATNATLHATNAMLHASNATLHATNATLHASNATLVISHNATLVISHNATENSRTTGATTAKAAPPKTDKNGSIGSLNTGITGLLLCFVFFMADFA